MYKYEDTLRFCKFRLQLVSVKPVIEHTRTCYDKQQANNKCYTRCSLLSYESLLCVILIVTGGTIIEFQKYKSKKKIEIKK